MFNRSIGIGMLAAVMTLGLVLTAVGQSGFTANNNFYHSGSITANAASQTVRTTRMRQGICDGWIFKNRDDADTIYLNANVVAGYNGDAQVSDINMVVIEPGEVVELEDSTIKEFKVISGGGDAVLYWLCGCK